MKSLRWRLFVVVTGAIVLTVAFTVILGATLTRRTADKNVRTALSGFADILAAQAQQEPSYIAQHYNANGVHVIVDRRANLTQYVATGTPSNGTLTIQGSRYIDSYRPLKNPRLGLLAYRPVTQPAAWGSLLRDLLLAGAVGALLAAILSYFLARSIAAPIDRVAAASRALAAGAAPEPLPTAGSTEVADLSRAFNDMASQLAASRESEKNFLLSVSHELKTPLTAIRGYAEGLADGVFHSDEAARTIQLEAGRLERLVRDLLDLARMNRSAFHIEHERVDLGAIAREVVGRHATSAEAFSVELSGDGGSVVSADYDRVLQIASNLVENALRETPAGGSVTVHAEGGTLVVSDTGPGLAPEDTTHAFDRFFLYDKHSKERSVGSGLGLAIVKQLTVAMGGTVSVTSAPGEGATFAVSLPLASGPQVARVDGDEVATAQPAE